MGINLKEDQFNSSNKLVFLKFLEDGKEEYFNLGDGFSTRNENETLDEKEIQYINSDSKTKVLISKTFDYTFEGNIVTDDPLNKHLANIGWRDIRNVKTILLTVFVNDNFYDEYKGYQATEMPVVLNSKSPTANAGEELALSITMTQNGAAIYGYAELDPINRRVVKFEPGIAEYDPQKIGGSGSEPVSPNQRQIKESY